MKNNLRKILKKFLVVTVMIYVLNSSICAEAAPICKGPICSNLPLWHYIDKDTNKVSYGLHKKYYTSDKTMSGKEYITKHGLNTYTSKKTFNLEQCLIDNPDLVAAGITSRDQVWNFLTNYDRVSPRQIHSINLDEEFYCLARNICLNLGTYDWNGNTLSVTEKSKIINDYMCKNYAYDNSYTYYEFQNMMLTYTGTCNAYMAMFDVLASISGINAGVMSSENHSWNVVQAEDGHWYEIDVTWNDSLNSCYYFMVRDHYNVQDNCYDHTTHVRATEMTWWINEDLY